MAVLFQARFQATSANALPLSGARLSFFQAGTTTPITVYQDEAEATPWTNPVVADAAGVFPPIYVTASSFYKFVLTDADGIVLQTVDNIRAPATGITDGSKGDIIVSGDVWRIAPGALPYLTPEMYGAVGDGTTDDRDALIDLFDASNTLGIPVDFGSKVYASSAKIAKTWTRTPVIRGAGGTIKCIAPSAIECVLEFTVDEFGVDIRGLTIDADLKAYNGLICYNTNSGMAAADIGDFVSHDLTVKNVYRSGTAFSGGFALRISGGYRKVHLIRPSIDKVLLAAGAGTPSVVGVAGIAIIASGTAESRQIIIDDPYIVDVKSEDISYLLDQDGININGLEDVNSGPNGSTVEINRPKIINAGGRSIKLARHGAIVNEPYFERNTGGAKTGGLSLIDIDFQFGSGVVNGGFGNYLQYAPGICINATLRGGASTGFYVRGFRWYATPTRYAPPSTVTRHGGNSHPQAPCVIEDVHGSGEPTALLISYSSVISTSANPAEALTVRGCGAELTDRLISLSGTSAPTISILATDNYNTGSSVELVEASGAIASTTGSANNRNLT